MNALVVYDSLWGNTQAIAEEIADGIGAGARALPTTSATVDVVTSAELVVAGSPVHGLALPSGRTKRTGAIQGKKPGMLEADTSQKLMRDWLAWLPRTGAYAAAFDTRMPGPFGLGGASRIHKGLHSAGFHMLAGPEGFLVDGVPPEGERGSLLREGERERAREWGRTLAQSFAAAMV